MICLIIIVNKNTKVRSFNSNEHIYKKEDGPNFEVSEKSLISYPVMSLQRKPEENMLQFSKSNSRQKAGDQNALRHTSDENPSSKV